MKRKWVLGIVAAGCLFLIIIFCNNTMPDYGIHSNWKKVLLNTLLSEDVPKISVMDAQALKGKAIFLDTRGANEYNISHIEGARFVGYQEFDISSLSDLPKDQPIITYCSIGKRSDVIGRKLIDADFTHVQNMYGGLFEWVNKGAPVVDAQNNQTQKIHAYNKPWGCWLHRGEKVY